jgi:hypothetical protein
MSGLKRLRCSVVFRENINDGCRKLISYAPDLLNICHASNFGISM